MTHMKLQTFINHVQKDLIKYVRVKHGQGSEPGILDVIDMLNQLEKDDLRISPKATALYRSTKIIAEEVFKLSQL